MIDKRISITVIFTLAFISVIGQHVEMRNYTTSDGLPSNEVFHVMQDSTGYIWFCTDNGVSRYDGYEFENFDSSDGLEGSAILFSYQDFKGRIWFVSLRGELSYYSNDSIHSYKWNNKLTKAYTNNPIAQKRGLYIDSDAIYLSVRANIYKVKKTGEISSWSVVNPMRNTIIDKNKKALISRFHHIPDSIQIIQENNIQYNVPNPSDHSSMGLGLINKIDRNHYLFSTGNQIIELRNKKIKTLYNAHEKSISEFHIDRSGRLWIGYLDHGIESYTDISLTNKKEKYLNGRSVSTALMDKQNGLWFTTLKEGVYYKPPNEIETINDNNILTSKKINYSSIDKNGKLILGTADNYINILDNLFNETPLKSRQIKLTHDRPDNNNFVLMDSSYAYFGTELGLYFTPDYNYDSIRLIKAIDSNKNKITSRTKDITKIGKNSLGIGLSSGYLVTESSYPNKNDILPSKWVTDMRSSCLDYDAKNHCTWIGSLYGLYQHKIGTDSLIHFGEKNNLLKNRIVDIKILPENKLALATKGEGLIIYNVEKDSASVIKTEEGLASNSLTSLVLDDRRLFAGTNKGINLINLNLNNKRIIQLDKSDGLVSNKINDLSIHDTLMLVSTNEGLSYFNLNNLNFTNRSSKVYIKTIRVPGQKSFTRINPSKKIKLSYPQSSLRLKFTPLTYNHDQNLTYKYRIKGLDKSWKYTTKNEIFFSYIPSGSYTFEIMVRNKSGYWSKAPTQLQFTVEPPLWNKLWFLILIITLTIAVVFVIIFLSFRNYKVKVQLKQDITKYQQQALSNQMNPHFIFNSLNSIHRYLLEKNSIQASKFLSKFARLMRLSLKNSQSQLIPISKEIESILIYLQLENLRMHDKFDYNIHVDENLDQDNTCIPSMLIQPLIENSIIHGIRYLKERRGQIDLTIEKEKKSLKITLEDNGVGRGKAAEIEQKKIDDSFGNSIVSKRIELLNHLYSSNISLKYLDLYNDNKGNGTKVVIENFPITKCDDESTNS